MALAGLGNEDEAAGFFHMLNPINHGRTPADVVRYKTEPYVIAGDLYAHAPHAGRGGWSWYTGSAGWMYQAGIGSILGLRRRRATFVIDPCIPSSWPWYRIEWRFLAGRSPARCRGDSTAQRREDSRGAGRPRRPPARVAIPTYAAARSAIPVKVTI